MASATTASGSLPVSALIGAPVAGVDRDATLVEVADALVAAGVGMLLVRGDDVISGVVSERDLVAAIAAGRDVTATTAIDVAQTGLVWCDADATVAEVAREMMDAYVRHVLVEDDGRLVGVVSARDLLGVFATAEPDPEES